MDSCSWLASFIEVNKLRCQLIIGNIEEEVLKKIIRVNCEEDGNLIYATNELTSIDNKLNLCLAKIEDIFISLQLNKIRPNLIFVNQKINDLLDIVKLVNNDVILIIKKNIYNDCFNNNELNMVLETNEYCFLTSKNSLYNSLFFKEFEDRIQSIEKEQNNCSDNPVIGIGVLTYNHEKYIEECLRAIYNQKCNYKLKLFIINDASTDSTKDCIESFLKNNKKKNIVVKFIDNKKNLGMIANMIRLFEFFEQTDYFTFCEGDDFWISNDRISIMVDFMKNNKEVSIAFNNLMIYDSDFVLKNYETHFNLNNTYFTTRDLINMSNFIGNFSCCFYNTNYLKYINKKIYNSLMYDLLFNVEYSRYGFIGRVNEGLSVYRHHSNSLWHSKKILNKSLELYNCIDEYNELSNFLYDAEYCEYKGRIVYNIVPNKFIPKDLVIIDNVFPSEYSQFTYQEITSYLENFENSICFATGAFLSCFNNNNFDLEIKKYYQNNPNLINRLKRYNENYIRIYNPKCMYFIFLSTLRMFFDYVEKNKISFVFELYPGGGMLFDNEECDTFLRKVMSSKYFKKVIVTQKPVMDYLLKKKICKRKKIEYIFGVVMPVKDKVNYIKKSYGFDKKNLDIVFMAHKYTEKGVDKGYDIFIETMKIICKKYNNIRIHVVGGFNENDIDVLEIKEKIEFYGELTGEQFDDFFSNKDIIISPNIPNKIFEGSFDGFPTASCTEAGLRKTAIFCTDPLGMNDNIFLDNKEIVIIEHDVNDILNKIEYYYKNFELLKQIGEAGYNKILNVYSYKNQIQPRIDVLNKIIESEKKIWQR